MPISSVQFTNTNETNHNDGARVKPQPSSQTTGEIMQDFSIRNNPYRCDAAAKDSGIMVPCPSSSEDGGRAVISVGHVIAHGLDGINA